MTAKRQLVQAIEAMPESVTIEEAVDRLVRAFKEKRSRDRDETLARLAQEGVLQRGAPNTPSAYAHIPERSPAGLAERLLAEERASERPLRGDQRGPALLTLAL